MKVWPVPKSYIKTIPKNGQQGSFWEHREDRHHCGIDIYAPVGSEVLAIEDGMVITVDHFTSPKEIPYWNETYYILLKNQDNYLCKYAELQEVTVKVNEYVKAGQVIGHIGQVLNKNKINTSSPVYIQKLKRINNLSMLHFELIQNHVNDSNEYLAGNCFGNHKPEAIINPHKFFNDII